MGRHISYCMRCETTPGESFGDTGKGSSQIPGYADDYAFLIWGLIELYETVFDVDLARPGREAARGNDKIFGAPDGGFYYAEMTASR